MAFYKYEDGQLLVGENFVAGPTYSLHIDDKDLYQYPVDGWYWFDTEEQARTVFGVGLDK